MSLTENISGVHRYVYQDKLHDNLKVEESQL
jgi:hypothetical protein